MSPARRRRAVTHLQRVFGVSQRWACQLVGQPPLGPGEPPVVVPTGRVVRRDRLGALIHEYVQAA